MKSHYLRFWKMRTVASILTISFFLLVQLALQAQDNVVSLKGNKIKLPENNYSVVEVIDARDVVDQRIDKSYIGLAYDYDLPGIKKPVKMDVKLEASLMSLFQSNSAKNTRQIPLIIKINKLFISDFGGKNDLQRVIEINLNFYIEENGVYYHEFMAGFYHNSSASDRSQRIDMMIIGAVEQCYIEFLHRMDNNWGYHQAIEKEKLKENSLNLEFMTQTRSDFNRNGIFYSFNDFRDNMADTITPFVLKKFGSESGLGYCNFKSKITDKGNYKVDEIWGAEFNGKLYLQVAGYFIPVIVTKDGYTIKNMTNFNRHNYARRGFQIGLNVVYISTAILGLIALGPAGLFYPSALLGLVGGGIGAGIGALSPKIEISDDKYKIDMATGMPLPITDNYRERIKGNNKENKTFWNTK